MLVNLCCWQEEKWAEEVAVAFGSFTSCFVRREWPRTKQDQFELPSMCALYIYVLSCARALVPVPVLRVQTEKNVCSPQTSRSLDISLHL